MKIIISESRLDSLIMNYLDEQFDGMTSSIDEESWEWWGVGDDCLIEKQVKDGVVEVGVSHEIWEGLTDLFSLTPTQADEYILEWLGKNLKIFPDELYIF